MRATPGWRVLVGVALTVCLLIGALILQSVSVPGAAGVAFAAVIVLMVLVYFGGWLR
jgi:uncharacterized BrkB/YihY/UPF0761 family membrane protein